MITPKNDDLLSFHFMNEDSTNDINDVLSDVKNEVSIEVDKSNIDDKWSNLPGAYGTYCGNPEQLNIPAITEPWPIISCVLNENNFTGKNNTTLKIANNILYQRANNNNRHTIRSTTESPEITQLYNINTGTFIENAVLGLLYTIEAIKNGTPIIFGVNCQPNIIDSDTDESTNHYIIIVGMGNDGRNFFYGWDVACLLSTNGDQCVGRDEKEGISKANKIYLDTNWPGLIRADSQWQNFYASARQPYKVTQILKTFTL